MNKNMKKILNLYIVLLAVLAITGSCTEDSMEIISEVTTSHVITLNFPAELVVDVTTRALTDNVANKVLAVVISNGKLKSESCIPVTNGSTSQITLVKTAIQEGDKLYLFANTHIDMVSATTEEELLNEMSCGMNTDYIPMYGSVIIPAGPISVDMKRVYAKVGINCSVTGLSVESWKICNVPSKGYIAKSTGYPDGTTFEDGTTLNSADIAYLIPRTDNSTTNSDKTYLLLKLVDKGWYRLDFYENGRLEITDKAVLMNLEANKNYQFNIHSVSSDGYNTQEEAIANTGSNILYDMEITNANTATSGQYSLLMSKSEIMLYPTGGNSYTSVEAIKVSALIPPLSEHAISTYYVKLVNPSTDITIEGDDDGDNVLDLIQSGVKLETNNSERNIKLKFQGANTTGSYLEFHLGNIVRKVPINVLSANCYLFDFSTGMTLYIPIIQANMKETRIQLTDVVTPTIVWSDQVNSGDLNLEFNADKQWITVSCDKPFIGNVVIAAVVNSEIRWSWHIWALPSDVISYNSTLGIFDLTLTNKYNGYTWMDRNLGACSVTPGEASNQGLLYQWGRKDPFTNGKRDGTTDEPLIYVKEQAYTMAGTSPLDGEDCIVSVVSDDNVDYSIKNPMKFIKGMPYLAGTGAPSTVTSNWQTNNYAKRRTDLWYNIDGSKTQFDPCPIGWKMPYGGESSPWAGLWPTNASAISENGITWTDAGFYPHAYTRTASAGDLVVANTSGSTFWWANTNDKEVAGTAFSATQCLYRRSSPFAAGLSVRCVKE